MRVCNVFKVSQSKMQILENPKTPKYRNAFMRSILNGTCTVLGSYRSGYFTLRNVRGHNSCCTATTPTQSDDFISYNTLLNYI